MLIADDESLVRRSLRTYLESSGEVEVVGEATDGREAVAMTRSLAPDVALIDLRMPHQDGASATAEIRSTMPSVRCVCVTTFGSRKAVLSAVHAGAQGYVVKDAAPDEIVDAVRTVHAGGYAFGDVATGQLVASARGIDSDPDHAREPLTEAERLTDRQRDVVTRVASGMSNGDIARDLHITEATVKTHLGAVMSKWNVKDRVQVTLRAARAGIVTI